MTTTGIYRPGLSLKGRISIPEIPLFLKGIKMPQKQGGKGKTSSPSRKASHLRGPARTAANKAKKMARHFRAVAKKADKAWHLDPSRSRVEPVQKAKAGTLEAPKFPRRVSPRPVERMILGGNPPKLQPHPLHLITCNGVILEISPRSQDAANAKSGILPRLGYRHEILHGDGRRTLVEKRNAN